MRKPHLVVLRLTSGWAAIVRAMIASADGADAPLRLPLGADRCRDVHAAYVQRLELLEASRDLALSVTASWTLAPRAPERPPVQ